LSPCTPRFRSVVVRLAISAKTRPERVARLWIAGEHQAGCFVKCGVISVDPLHVVIRADGPFGIRWCAIASRSSDRNSLEAEDRCGVGRLSRSVLLHRI